MSLTKLGLIVAGSYLAFASAIIAFDYYGIVHRQPGDDRWWGMMSALVTAPTWLVLTPLWKLATDNTTGLSHEESMALLEFSALVNALIVYAAFALAGHALAALNRRVERGRQA